MLVRAWHFTIAVLVAAAIVLQIVIAIRVSGSPHDVSVGLLRGSSLPGRIIRVLSFFTIESNLLCGIVSAQLARRPARDGVWWRPLRLAALFGITVTGIVYSTVLARIHQPNGVAETAVNTVVHYIVPVMMVVGWLVAGPRPRIDVRTVWFSLIFPVAWFAYTLVRGAIWKWYPYPFVDVTTHGYARVIGNALLVTVVLAVVAALFAVGDRRLPPAPDARVAVATAG
ncbi:MAG: Pr6Pr family membrane protein [Acidobacteriota bacterium]|nr:Pr6Pr family membrane protein [Acidobacteriota bacterium]